MAPLPISDRSRPTSGSISSLLLSACHKARKTLESTGRLDLLKRDIVAPTSPLDINAASRRRDVAKSTTTFVHGKGTVNPASVNNRVYFAFFAIIGAALVVASLWFFFRAKHGGFVFRKGDWDDYKSTVLRRKGPDGKTLSNATKSTDLGGISVQGDYDQEDIVGTRTMGRDDDVREYRHEKPARVGGLNRKPDGSYYDHTNTDRSEIMSEKPAKKKAQKKAQKKAPKKTAKKTTKETPKKAPAQNKKGGFLNGGFLNGGLLHFMEKKDKGKKAGLGESNVTKKEANRGRQPSTAYSFTQGDDTATNVSAADETASYSSERRFLHHQTPPQSEYSYGSAPPTRHSHRPHSSSPHHQHQRDRSHYHDSPTRGSRQSSPRKYAPSSTGTYTYTDTLSQGSYLTGDDSDLGTKSYHHVIPGLTSSAGDAGSAVVGASAAAPPPPKTRTERSERSERSESRYQDERSRRAELRGYRRGGGRMRRDSLSDSEGETGTARS
ncbi:MAG: hypothetical protein M1819_006727 [Sarea resinae]|nr:MAG: hypothetical protein M1819_006727 [Sarea resinae]